jgi:hypothetical protein
MKIPGVGNELNNKLDIQLRNSARKIAQQHGLRSVPELAHVMIADRRALLLYIRKHWDEYQALG